jgi:hypothetical protein
MNKTTRSCPCPFRGARALAALALAAGGLGSCSSAAAPRGDAGAAHFAPSVPTPLATSVQTSSGTWATIPMGRLDEPLNTFWQLLFLPARAASWSNQVEATATATNGGLVLSAGGRSLVVGVLPSVDLTFTPLVATSDPERSWSTGLITAELAARPDALASGAGGQWLALINGRGGAEVMSALGSLSAWRPLVTRRALAMTGAGQSCGLGALTAVGYASGRALIGGSCNRPGVVGLFAPQGGAWHLAGPSLPRPWAGGGVEVLALGAQGGATSALLAVMNGSQTALVAAWSHRAGLWATSAPFRLGRGEQVASVGPADGNGLFALLQEPSGPKALMVAGRSTGWQELPSPPSSTATVAFVGERVDALSPDGTVLTIWSLSPGADRWARRQLVDVPVQFGSSS